MLTHSRVLPHDIRGYRMGGGSQRRGTPRINDLVEMDGPHTWRTSLRECWQHTNVGEGASVCVSESLTALYCAHGHFKM